MRELTSEEIEQVSGGVGPYGAVFGGVAGGIYAAADGGNFGQIAAGAALGAVSGFFGGIAAVTSGATRLMFSAYALETGLLGSRTTS